MSGNVKQPIIMPTGGRLIVGWIAVAGFVGFLIALGVAYYFDFGFVITLSLAFCWFLSLTHMHFAFAQNLTQRRVRKIDYWYLGSAAIGLLLFATAYSNQRESVLGRSKELMYRAGETSQLNDIRRLLKIHATEACSELILSVARSTCGRVTEFFSLLKPGLSPREIATVEDTFRGILVSNYSAVRDVVTKQRKTANESDGDYWKAPYYRSSLDVSVALTHWQEWAKEAAKLKAQPSGIDEEVEVLFGLGQMIVWPFLLAFALALRITKVTVDVFEWTD
jgi:hypothetical protein